MDKEKTTIGLSVVLGLLLLVIATLSLFIVENYHDRGRMESMMDRQEAFAGEIARNMEAAMGSRQDTLELVASMEDIRYGSSSTCSKRLREVLEVAPEFYNMGRVDRTGVFDCSAMPGLVGVNITEEVPYVQASFEEGRPVLGYRVPHPVTNETVTSLHTPIYGPNGSFAGTVGFATDFSSIVHESMKDVNLPDGWVPIVLDSNGDMLYSGEGSITAENIFQVRGRMEPHTNESLEELLAGEGVDHVTYEAGNRTYVSTLASASFLPERTWQVMLLTPREKMASATGILGGLSGYELLLAVIVVSMVTSLLIFNSYLVFGVFRPVKELEESIEDIEAGDVEVTIDERVKEADDEIGRLARAFDSSMERIRSTMQVRADELEEKNSQLQRQIALQKGIMEATADAILVVDRNGEIVAHNQNFKDMWGVPDVIMESEDDAQALAHVKSKLKDPEGFMERVEEIYNKPSESSFDILEFRDGRVVERYSRPYEVEGEIAGRVWSFHDVTYNAAIEREFEQATSLLRTVLDSTADGVLVVNPDMEYIYYNQRFLDMFDIPEQVFEEERDARKIFAQYRDQFEDPEGFREKIEQYDEQNVDEIFEDTFVFREQTFKRISRPFVVDGEYRGRVTSFRPIDG